MDRLFGSLQKASDLREIALLSETDHFEFFILSNGLAASERCSEQNSDAWLRACFAF